MKVFICILGLIAIASCGKVDEAKMKECAAKYKITDMTLVDKFMKPGFTTTNKDEKCFGMCIGQAGGCLTSEGKLAPGKEADAPDFLDKAKIPAAFTECSKLMDADPCETAYKQWTCFLDKAKKM